MTTINAARESSVEDKKMGANNKAPLTSLKIEWKIFLPLPGQHPGL
jgi:hypothetical protein